MAVIFDLPSFPIEQVREMRPLEWSWGNWFAANPFPMRLLAISQAFDMRQPIKRLERDRDALAWVARIAAPSSRRSISTPSLLVPLTVALPWQRP